MKERVVIIGSSITGFYLVNELVKNHFDGKITLIDEKGDYPYNTYPLSKEWMMDGDTMEPPLLKSKEFYEENGIDLRLNTKVSTINAEDQSVMTHLNETIPYDHLVIATGSKLRKLNLPGGDAEGVFYLRDFSDAKRIKQWAKNAENVVIIGSGFIGLELASTFSQLDKKVSIIQRSGKPLERILGAQVSDYFMKMHQSHHVNFFLNEETEKIVKDERGQVASVLTKSGTSIEADMVLIAVGVEPNISFEVDSLETDRGIIVNEFGETSLANVYAGGDVVMWPYRNKLIHVEHWETAWSQGISIARNILNKRSNQYSVVPYFWTDQYDETFEYLGNARAWDKMLNWGKMEEGKFAVAYVDENNYPLAILFANKFLKRKDVQEVLSKNQALDENSFDAVIGS